MDMLIPKVSNSSSTGTTGNNMITNINLTALVFDDAIRNCTPLHRLDLVDVFAKMDVGSTA